MFIVRVLKETPSENELWHNVDMKRFLNEWEKIQSCWVGKVRLLILLGHRIIFRLETIKNQSRNGTAEKALDTLFVLVSKSLVGHVLQA